MNIRNVLPAALAFAIAACSPAGSPPDATTGTPADRSADESASDIGTQPPTPPAAPTPPAPPVDPDAGADADPGAHAAIGFAGYRDAPFGSDAAALRAAYDGALAALPPPESPEACHYLMPPTTPGEGYATAFMFEGARFVRIDVATADVVAPGGLAVGMTAADVRAAFPGVETQPHKYVEGGQVLVAAPADGGDARLVFEIDPQGIITEWRIGLAPQVHYVEGCS